MCTGGSPPAPPEPPIVRTYVPMPEYTKVDIPPTPVTRADMKANRLSQGRAVSPRKKLTRSERGTQSLRIRRYA